MRKSTVILGSGLFALGMVGALTRSAVSGVDAPGSDLDPPSSSSSLGSTCPSDHAQPLDEVQSEIRVYWAACETCSWSGEEHPNDKGAAIKDKKAHLKDHPNHSVKIRSVGMP